MPGRQPTLGWHPTGADNRGQIEPFKPGCQLQRDGVYAPLTTIPPTTELLRTRGSKGEQEQSQHLAKGNQDKTVSHARSLAAMTTTGLGPRNSRSDGRSLSGTLQA